MRPTLVIAGGYTAGHITPGLALAEALRDEADCVFMGSADGLEASLVPAAGFAFAGLPAHPWAGRSWPRRLLALAALAPAVWQARAALRRADARVLVGLGSFAALAPGLAAASLGIPVILFEANTTCGLANRVLRPFARTLLASRLYRAAAGERPAPQVVGVPLRAAVGELAGHRVAFPETAPRVLVLGGSLGNPFLNQRMPAVLGRLAETRAGLSVVHQCGRGIDPGPILRAYAGIGVPADVPTYADPIAPLLSSAHLVVATAGAITLHELAAAGIPALIVPLEGAAARHQHDNAFGFTALTGCPHASEATWDDDRVAGVLSDLLRSREAWETCSRRLRSLSSDGAAARAAALIRPLLR